MAALSLSYDEFAFGIQNKDTDADSGFHDYLEGAVWLEKRSYLNCTSSGGRNSRVALL